MDEAAELKKRTVARQREDGYRQSITRFAQNYTGVVNDPRHRTIRKHRKHSLFEIETAVRMCREKTIAEVSSITGISYALLRQIITFIWPAKKGKCTAENLRRLVVLARELHRATGEPARWCLKKVALADGITLPMFWQHLSNEAWPALPGFPLYADPDVQARAEAYGLGKRASASRFLELFPNGTPGKPQNKR